MNKKIEWKKSEFDYDELNEISHKDLTSAETLKQHRRPDLGGKKQLGNANISKWMQENEEEFFKTSSEGGKLGGLKTKELGIGIHNKDMKSEWGKLGSISRKTLGHPPTNPILVFKDTEFIKEYPSLSECARDMKLDKGNIHKVIKGIYKQHKGYKFEYKQ